MLLEATRHTFTDADHSYKPDRILPIGELDANNSPKQVVVALCVCCPATAATGAPPLPTPPTMITTTRDDCAEVPDRAAA